MFYNPALGVIALSLIVMSLVAREWPVSGIRRYTSRSTPDRQE